MRVLINGISGYMGKIVYDLISKDDSGFEFACGVDPYLKDDCKCDLCVRSFSEAATDVDVIIDFSHHSATKNLLEFAVKNNIALVLATTGQTEEELNMINDASKKIPLFFASNYSLGIALLVELAKKSASVMPDAEVEIVEVHHDRKIDAPSGTALTLANEIKSVKKDSEIICGRSGECKRKPNDIGVNSVRMGNIAGIHEVYVGTQNQTITLKHEAHDRAVFAEGALSAAKFIVGKAPGLYDMNDLLNV